MMATANGGLPASSGADAGTDLPPRLRSLPPAGTTASSTDEHAKNQAGSSDSLAHRQPHGSIALGDKGGVL
jgi:hypothetical protein